MAFNPGLGMAEGKRLYDVEQARRRDLRLAAEEETQGKGMRQAERQARTAKADYETYEYRRLGNKANRLINSLSDDAKARAMQRLDNASQYVNAMRTGDPDATAQAFAAVSGEQWEVNDADGFENGLTLTNPRTGRSVTFPSIDNAMAEVLLAAGTAEVQLASAQGRLDSVAKDAAKTRELLHELKMEQMKTDREILKANIQGRWDAGKDIAAGVQSVVDLQLQNKGYYKNDQGVYVNEEGMSAPTELLESATNAAIKAVGTTNDKQLNSVVTGYAKDLADNYKKVTQEAESQAAADRRRDIKGSSFIRDTIEGFESPTASGEFGLYSTTPSSGTRPSRGVTQTPKPQLPSVRFVEPGGVGRTTSDAAAAYRALSAADRAGINFDPNTGTLIDKRTGEEPTAAGINPAR